MVPAAASFGPLAGLTTADIGVFAPGVDVVERGVGLVQAP
jgi:hypothetical protein